MKFIDHTFVSPAENLAWEEFCLDLCEAGELGEMLRFYESTIPFVVLGYGNNAETEVNLNAARSLGIPVLRRISGGGTVVQGPGCLSYALFCEVIRRPQMNSVSATNSFIMQRHRTLFSSLYGREVTAQGHTDLALAGRKFSGNAQRRKRKFVLFHGTFLLNFDLDLVTRLLNTPSTQPSYRNCRNHRDFLTNLGMDSAKVMQLLISEWQAQTTSKNPLSNIPQQLVAKYNSDEWNLRI